MRNKLTFFLQSVTLVFFFLLAVGSSNDATVALAQSTAPTPLPLPATNTLIVVAGGYGTTLFTDDSAYLTQLTAGARLVADQQSADGQWMHVTTATGETGWARRDALLVFDRIALPTANVVIAPAPSPTPTVIPTVMAAAPPNAPVADQGMVATTETVTDTTAAGSAAVVEATENAGGTIIQAAVRTGTSRLNIRSGPSTGYPVIAKATSGETLTILARNEDQSWLYVARVDNVRVPIGWAATQFLALTEPLTDVAVRSTVVNTPAQQSSLAPSTTASVARPAGLQGKLVFSERNGGVIYLYQLGTGGLIQLTTGLDPALSPDGTQVAFTRGGGENGIYLINVDGSNEHQIFGDRELLRSPKWSPNGQWLVFSRGDEFNKCYLDKDTGECLPNTPFFTEGLATGKDHIRKLARIDLNGDNYRDLAVVEDAVTPDWNSAGIVYQSGSGLQITQDKPEDENRLLYFEILRQYHQDPDWQPGNGRIIFQQRQGGHYEIFAINPDGSGLTALTRPVTTLVDQLPSNVSPAWSFDGQSIVFLSNRTAANNAGPWRLWVMNADGSNQRPLPVDVSLQYDYASEQMVDWGP